MAFFFFFFFFFLFFFLALRILLSGITVLLFLTAYKPTTVLPRPTVTI